jgi:hypothetical protein
MATVQTTIKVNPSLGAKIKAMQEELDVSVKSVLKGMANDLVEWSPVDTGAYVNSHSIRPAGIGGGRMKSSENKPRFQEPEAQKAAAREELFTDINNLSIEDVKSITIRNRSKHASDVENGWVFGSKTIDGYHVYTMLKDKYR